MASDSGFNINKFKSQMNQDGILKPSNAFVRVYPGPDFGLAKFGELEVARKKLEFHCEATNLPGVRLMTTEIRRHGYGVVEKKPYVPIFTDINLMFRSDSKGLLYKFFQSWIKMIINFDGRDSINSVNGSIRGQALYEVAYKNSYSSTIEISVFDPNGEIPITITLVEAYPIFLGEIPLAWAAVNDYIKIPVQFTFRDWYIDNYSNVDPENRLETIRLKENSGPPLL